MENGLRMLEQNKGLVLKLAWQFWKKLPASTKVWVDPSDLIEDAYVYMLARARKKYDKKRAAKTTFLWTGVGNLFLNFALSQQTKKRFGWSVPIDELHFVGKRDGELDQMEARDALNRTYKEASPALKAAMLRWFGPGKPRLSKLPSAKKIHYEFLTLAQKNKLSKEDCRKLMGACVWTN